MLVACGVDPLLAHREIEELKKRRNARISKGKEQKNHIFGHQDSKRINEIENSQMKLVNGKQSSDTD